MRKRGKPMGGEKKDSTGWFFLLTPEFSLILFLFYALLVEPGKPGKMSRAVSRCDVSTSWSNVFVTNSIPVKEETMKWQPTADEELHTEVHIDLCPNDTFHIKIDNICLHLCRHDLLHLAQALQEAADRVAAPNQVKGKTRDVVH